MENRGEAIGRDGDTVDGVEWLREVWETGDVVSVPSLS